MTYSRTTTVSDASGGDSVVDGCLKLDTDMTLGFRNLNQVYSTLSSKVPIALKGAANGVCELDEDSLIPVARLPAIPASLLPGGETCPIGTITYWPSVVVTDGFMECDGRWLSKTEYADLFAVIGSIYGGNSTKFRLPEVS